MITNKITAEILAEVFSQQGCSRCIASPGSRNAPLIVAFEKRMITEVVIDERSAAFRGLGMAQVTGKPVVLLCTSGSALLNYGPALAEAFYQGVPLIVISADRPFQWIDQDDSQTIRQPGAFPNIVKGSYDIPDGQLPNNEIEWFANRIANEAWLTAIDGKPGPVHINIQFQAPLTEAGESIRPQRLITQIKPEETISRKEALELALKAKNAKILVVAGFHNPSHRLNRSLQRFATLPNVYILHETIANLRLHGDACPVDTLIASLSDEEAARLRPDLVISFGGALVSRLLKQYLRTYSPSMGHWHIGGGNSIADCFKSLTCRISTPAHSFFSRIGGALARLHPTSDYANLWKDHSITVNQRHESFVCRIPWCDMKAMQIIFNHLETNVNLQLSNGTPIRYAQILQRKAPHSARCNRGVSGIDGCTSTAIGAATVYNRDTLLITGDLSFTYDLSALIHPIPSRLHIIVFNNGGGSIFRFVNTTSTLPTEMREKYFCADPGLDFRKIANTFGLEYSLADSIESLENYFSSSMEGPSLLEIRTDGELSSRILKDYFAAIKTNSSTNKLT